MGGNGAETDMRIIEKCVYGGVCISKKNTNCDPNCSVLFPGQRVQ